MNIKITKDTLDGSNWTNVEFSAPTNGLDHDKITSLRALRHRHKLAGGGSNEHSSTAFAYCTAVFMHIENPTIDFEKDLMLWRMS
jgi:hypothetical protein